MLCSNQAVLKSSKPVGIVSEKTVFIHSNIHSTNGIRDNVVVEFTDLKEGCSIGEASIISNNIFPADIHVPPSSFLHTVVIKDGEQQSYVTVAFGTEDNLKKTCQSREDASKLIYAGLSFDKALANLQLSSVCPSYLVVVFFTILISI